MALASSTRLGAYEIVSQIGAGGMGEVYCAQLKRDEMQRAWKMISGSLRAIVSIDAWR